MSLDVKVAWDRPASSGDSEHWLLVSLRGVQAADTPRALAILVDTSTSMVGERLARARATVESVVRSCPHTDRVLVLGFGSSVVRVVEVPGGSGVGGALGGLMAAGKTRLDLALVEAESWLKHQTGRRHILLLTDGDPTDIEGKRTDIAPLVERARSLAQSGVRFTVVGLGSADRYDASFLRSLADAAGGVAVVGVPAAKLVEQTSTAIRGADGDTADVDFELDSSELSLLEAWRVKPRVQPLHLRGRGGTMPAGMDGAILLRTRFVVGLGARRGERRVGTLLARQRGASQVAIPLLLNLVPPGSSERAVLNIDVDRLRMKVELARTAQLRAGAEDWDDQVRLTRQLASLADQLGDPRATMRIQTELDLLDGGEALCRDARETAVDDLRGGKVDG